MQEWSSSTSPCWPMSKHFRNSAGVHSEKLLSMDNYYSHINVEVQTAIRESNTLISYIPPGCTDLIQVNDRALGKLFKDKMTEKINAHLEENWDTWFSGDINASKRRILLTEFAGQAWEEVCQDQKVITRSFEAWPSAQTRLFFIR